MRSHKYPIVVDRQLSTAGKVADSIRDSSIYFERLQLQQDTVLQHKGAYFIIHDGRRISVGESFLQEITYNMSTIIDASSIDVVDYIPQLEPVQYPKGTLPGYFNVGAVNLYRYTAGVVQSIKVPEGIASISVHIW